jgi:hypothetical protein
MRAQQENTKFSNDIATLTVAAPAAVPDTRFGDTRSETVAAQIDPNTACARRNEFNCGAWVQG